VHASAHQVVFRYAPNSEAGQPKGCASLALTPQKFVARVLQHAPEPGRHTVRYYGLYAHACAEALNAARALHAQAPVEPPQPIEWQAYLARFPGALAATRCPQCQAPLVRGALIPATRHPP
jgi:hypothetical protein